MQNIILYTRVSTDEQADRGFSLNHQKAVLELYCRQKGLTILKHFVEDYSAKDFNRPSWKELHLYAKSNKKNIDAILVTKWDRFSRQTELAYKTIREFKNWGIEINAIEQPLDTSQPDSKVMLGIYLILPEVENDKISMRTTEGMRRGSIDGAWMGTAPMGYLHHRTQDGKSTLKPNPQLAPIIKKVFQEYATGIYSSEEIRKRYYSELKITKNGLLHLLKNPVYCGKITIKQYKKEQAMIVEGLHEAIIDIKTFEKVQKVFMGKQVKPVLEPKAIDEMLPLRGFLQCTSCQGRTLTGSGSKGRSGKRYYFYHCNPPCKVRYKSDDVHELLNKLLTEFVINEDCQEIYKKIVYQTFKSESNDREMELKSLKREVNKLEVRLENIDDRFFDGDIDLKTYNSNKRKVEVQISELKMKLDSIKSTEKDFEDHLKKGISFLHKVDVVYKNAPSSIKKKILATLFPEKLVFENTYFKTLQLDEFIGYILLNNKKLKYLKIEKHNNKKFNYRTRKVTNLI